MKKFFVLAALMSAGLVNAGNLINEETIEKNLQSQIDPLIEFYKDCYKKAEIENLGQMEVVDEETKLHIQHECSVECRDKTLAIIAKFRDETIDRLINYITKK